MTSKEQVDDLLSRILVEVAGWLVRHNDRRIRCQRACDRDALLFAPGKFGRVMIEPFVQPDRGKLLARAALGVRDARQFKRDRDILERSHCRNEMERLEDNADMPAAELR